MLRHGAPVRACLQRHGHDMAGRALRHGHDTAPNAHYVRGLGAVRAQPGPRVGALCTRLSFDSVHCSESLFGTMFKNTVHEHYS